MSQRRRASAAGTIAPASPTGGRQSSLIEDYDGKIPIVNRMSRDTTTLDEGFASLGNLNDDSREDARVTPGSFCKHRRPVSSSSFTTTSSSENENIIGDTRLAGVSGEAERSLMEDKEGSCKDQEGEGSPGASELLGKGNNISVPLATPGLSVKADYRCSPKRLPRASFDEAAQVVMRNGTKSGLVTQVTVDSINLNEVYSYAPNERKGSDVSEFSLVDIGSQRRGSEDSAIDMTLRSRASVARASIYEPILESADLEERTAEPDVGTEEGGDLQVRPPTLDFPQHPPETCQTELRISAVNLHRPHPFVRFVRYILRLVSICIPRSQARSVPVPLINHAFSGSEEDETHPSAAEDRKSSGTQKSCFPPPTLEPTWRSHPTHNPQPSPPPPPVSPPSTPRASSSCPPEIPLKDFLLSFDRTRSRAEDAGLNVIGRMVQIANFAAAMLDSRGGFLSIDALDVHLYVPPGAIPVAESPQRVYIYVQGGLTSGRNYVTPYVHCGPSGYHFKKDVALTLPHCAKGDQEFTFEKTSSARSTVLQDPDVAVLIQSQSVTLTMDHFCGIGAHGSCKSLLVCAFIKHSGKDVYIHIRVFNNTKVNFKEVEKEEQDQGFVLGPSRQELLEPQRENPVVITFKLSTEKWEITHPESTLVAEQRIQPEYLWRQCSSDSVETFPSKSFSARCRSLSGSDTFSGVLRVFQEGKEDAAVVLIIESPGKVGTFKKHPTSNELDALMFDELKQDDRSCVAELMDPGISNQLCDILDKPLEGGKDWHYLPEYLMEDGDHGHGWVASIEAKAQSQGRSPTELVLITFFTASRGKGKQQTLRDLNSGLSKLCEARQDIQFAVDATERKLGECEDERQHCKNCKKMGHFSKVCRSRPKQMQAILPTDSEEDDMTSGAAENEFFVGAVRHKQLPIDDIWRQDIYIHGHTVSFLLDTGLKVNILPQDIFNSLNIPDKNLQPSSTRLTGFFGGKATPIGETTLICQVKGKTQTLRFLILAQGEPVIGKHACEVIDLVQCVYTLFGHESVFEGGGCLHGQTVNIKIDEAVTPYCVTTPHRIPIPLMPQLKEELEKTENLGIIQRITKPTDWCSPIVIAPKKNGAIRL